MAWVNSADFLWAMRGIRKFALRVPDFGKAMPPLFPCTTKVTFYLDAIRRRGLESFVGIMIFPAGYTPLLDHGMTYGNSSLEETFA